MMKAEKIIKSICFVFCAAALITAALPAPFSAKAKDADNKQIMVSLGDSYSSGEGIEPFYGQDADVSEKVNNPDWLAHRSQKSWPGMLKLPSLSGTMADHKDKNWYFAAVSGAVTGNLSNSQSKEYNKDWSKYSGVYDIAPQLDVFDEIGENQADYVTLTLGGNDAGFANVITDAVLGSTYLNISGLADRLNNTWNKFYQAGGIRDSLRKAYQDIAAKAGPQARIIVAGYPQLLSENGNGIFISRDEAAMINTAVSNFNNEIENLVTSCKASDMKICFVSVEEAFKGHGAYSDDPYINNVIFAAKPEDLKDIQITSAYSIHPNYSGARAYAECVQKKIDALEADGGRSEWTNRTTSDERDVVLVLDVSGSMAGTPIEETKKASKNFVSTVLKEDASIGIVTYDNTAMMLSDFNVNENYLNNAADGINSGGGTNIEAGLQKAEEMLASSSAEKKIIVLMSDGEPNDGKVGDELVAYADRIKDEGIYIYTLGFFKSIGGSKSAAQILMEEIASDGCHYEVADADNLVFFFGDIADQINGQKYIYVRIACPVDVTVSHGGETLCSVEDALTTRTSFGSLTFEENETVSEDSSDNRIKVLRLKEGTDYDVEIKGNGRGFMNYTIGFMDDTGEYSDLRRFEHIKITKRTVIDTVAESGKATVLNVDEDGDGKYDVKYKATENGRGEIVDYTYLVYIAIGAVVVIAILVILVKVKKRSKIKNHI